jgi:hypothetical protein
VSATEFAAMDRSGQLVEGLAETLRTWNAHPHDAHSGRP